MIFVKLIFIVYMIIEYYETEAVKNNLIKLMFKIP